MMKKHFRENYDNICEEYTQSQLDFYKQHPDVTRILTYYLFSRVCEWLLHGPNQREFTVLDPCCGFGKDNNFFQSYLEGNYPDTNVEVISGDSSQGMLQIAKDSFGASNLLHRPYEDTGLMDECVDVVATRYGLDYPLDPDSLAKELFRVLKPSGYLIGTINHQHLMDQLDTINTTEGIDFLILPAFHGEVSLIKPRLGRRCLDAIIDAGFDVFFSYSGTEHPAKFPVPFKADGTEEYTTFVAKKRNSQLYPSFMEGDDTKSFIKGIRKLEDGFRNDPGSNYDGFVACSDILSLLDYNLILTNIITEGLT